MDRLAYVRFLLGAAIILVCAIGAQASDRFAVAVGSHDMLMIFGPKGDPKAELPLPSISQSVLIDNTTCQVSYGRDANNLLTAIIAPDPAQPQDLHFTVLNKAIDTDKSAVVTLTFSQKLDKVKIDPGYIGSVDVDSHRLQHDAAINRASHGTEVARTETATPQATLAGSSATPASEVAAAETADFKPATTAPPITVPIPEPLSGMAANQQANLQVDGAVSDHAPLPIQTDDASQMPFTATATPGPSTVSVVGSEISPKQHYLYWAEPITSPNGRAPQVASDDMMLVEVSGSVSVKEPGVGSRDGIDGMLLPSGTIVSTSGGASAAVFMGGVNSIRLVPDSEVQINQELDGSTRKTVIALHEGTVFSRVGHRAGETQDYQVQSPQGVAMAKGTEFADSILDGHHYVFVVKGIVALIVNGIQTGLLTPTGTNLASGAMPPADDGNKVLFQVLSELQPFQTKLQKVIADINNGTATPAELGFFDSLRNTFSVLVDDVYDPTHPNSFLGAFTSTTGFGDSTYSSLERPQDFSTPNPLNPFNGFQEGAAHPFFTPSVTPTNPNEIAPST
jgi:hypothetical protein